MKKILIILLVVLMAAMSAQVFAADVRTAKVSDFYGDVQVRREASEKTIKVFKNMRLDEGDTIITGKDSKVVLTLDGDKEIIVAANTVVVLSELAGSAGSTETTLTLKSGGVGSKIEKKLDPNSKYKIKTPTAVMGVRGTEFYVQVRNGKADVWLATGVIEIEYRMDGKKLAQLAQTSGKLKSKLLVAPNCISLPSAGEVFGESPRKFQLNGLYKEFLDQKVLAPLNFSDADFEEAVVKADADLQKLEDIAVESPVQHIAYDDLASYDGEPVNTHDNPAPRNQVYVGIANDGIQTYIINALCDYEIVEYGSPSAIGTPVSISKIYVVIAGDIMEFSYIGEIYPGMHITELSNN